MGKNDEKDSKEKIDTLKVDDYFKDAPTDEEPRKKIGMKPIRKLLTCLIKLSGYGL